jgi:CDP-diacylglycerol--glycerol-3-phosphate 3-phosphatidyltransferase
LFGATLAFSSGENEEMASWTPNRVTALRVAVGFAAVALFGRGKWANLAALALTLATIALDALDGHLARKKQMATPLGAQLDILGDRMIENMFFTYFAVVGLVSLWLPVFFFARGAATDFLRGLALKSGYSGCAGQAMTEGSWGYALVASRWSRGLYAALKCACFCYLGLELALMREPAGFGALVARMHLPVRAVAHVLSLATALLCLLRGFPVLLRGWRFFGQEAAVDRQQKPVEAA